MGYFTVPGLTVALSEKDSDAEVGFNRNEDKDMKKKVTFNKGAEGKKNGVSGCPYVKKCGGCQYRGEGYAEHLKGKQALLERLIGPFCRVQPIIGMDDPFHYRNKVHAVFDRDKRGNIISGTYQEGTHYVVPIENCLIEDKKADEVIGTIRGMLKSFKIKVYDEDTGYGLLRHVLVKRGFHTGQIMVVLVTASPVFPSKNNFVKALRDKHPEITTIIQNQNGRNSSMVLGDKEHVLYGKGYIEDVLCGLTFRISAKSFYQINPVQTEKLYSKAIELAGLKGSETVIDAYCGIGTIGLIAAGRAKQVIGVELSKAAVRDAIYNAKYNAVKNIRFFAADAGAFMVGMAEQNETADVVFMDPPRSGSTETFIDAVSYMAPKKVVYISCNQDTLIRDLKYFRKKGYEPKECWGVDMFPWTDYCETICLLNRINTGK